MRREAVAKLRRDIAGVDKSSMIFVVVPETGCVVYVLQPMLIIHMTKHLPAWFV